MTVRSNSKQPAATEGEHLRQAAAVLADLRDAVRRMVDSSPVPIRRAADLSRTLEVDAPLGWQIFRLAVAADPFAAVPYIPRAGSMDKVLRHAAERSFDAAAIGEVRLAFDRFEEVVRRIAGGRGNFDAMVAALGRETSGLIEVRHRGAAFRANTHVWGLSADTDYRVAIWHPGSSPRSEHVLSIFGRVNLRQLRPDAVLCLRSSIVTDEGGASVEAFGTLSLVEGFGSDPPPVIEVVRDADAVRQVIRPGAVGAAGAITFFVHELARDWNEGRAQTSWGLRCLVNVPSEVMILDMLVPRGWSAPATARLTTHGNLANPSSVVDNAEPFRLPTRETVRHLGAGQQGLEAMHTPEVPRCPEMIRAVLRRLEWDGTAFDVYRCRIRYPILHSMVALMVGAAE